VTSADDVLKVIAPSLTPGDHETCTPEIDRSLAARLDDEGVAMPGPVLDGW
jgi:hypothetical protein